MANSPRDRTSMVQFGRGTEAVKGMPSVVQDKSFSFRVRRGVTGLLMLLLASACSAGTDRLNAWPGLGGTHTKSSSPEDSRGTGKASSNQEVGSHEDSLPGDESMDPGEEGSEDDEANTSSSDAERESATGSESQTGSDESTSEGETSGEESGPGSCKQEICLEINSTQEVKGEPWKYRRYIFPFKIPKNSPRLARVEFMEGLTKGKTRVILKRSIGKGQGPALARWSWDVDMPNETGWSGGNPSEPIRLQSETWYWLEFIPAKGSVASVAKKGRDVSLWHRTNPTRPWVKAPVPAMFRAYCCVQ